MINILLVVESSICTKIVVICSMILKIVNTAKLGFATVLDSK